MTNDEMGSGTHRNGTARRVQEYIHRVGRTARMGGKGRALLFLLPSEVRLHHNHGGNGTRSANDASDTNVACRE